MKQKPYTQPTIRIPKLTAQRMHAASEDLKKARKKWNELFIRQCKVHAWEISVYVNARMADQEALVDAVRIIDALRRNEATPADFTRIEELRLLAMIGGSK
jgi:hypothetical protein